MSITVPRTLALRPYQEDAMAAIQKAEVDGVRRMLVAHATGLGKTILFAHLIQSRPGRALVLCHRDELISQAVEKIGIVAPHLDIGVVKAQRDEHHADVVVASVQSLHTRRLVDFPTDFTTVVCDEAHHSSAPSWRRVLDHVDTPETLILGVTATPERGDGTGLDTVFEKIVHEMPILKGIIAKYLCDIRGQVVGTDADLSAVHVRRGDLVEAELGAEFERSGALAQIAGGYCQFAADRKGIAFLPSVATAFGLAHELRMRGVAAEAIEGNMPLEERRAILGRFKTDETRVVCNCAILTEGFDEPSIDCIVIARPTRSRLLYIQMLGRGTRPYPGKEDCLILDVTGASERHDLISIGDLAGVQALGGRTLTQAVAEETERAERDPHAVERALLTKTVDLFASKLRWLPVEAGYCLPAGEQTVVLVPHTEDRWLVVTAQRGAETVVHEGLPLHYAQGVGEDIVRQEGAPTLSTRSAGWLRREPTAAQLRRLAQYGLKDTSKVTTRGQAADLITRVQARRVIRRRGGKR